MSTGSKTKELWKDPAFRARMVAAHKGKNMKHGYSKRGERHPLYVVWTNMRRRCGNKKTWEYTHYGGRGIEIEWRTFQEFVNDMEASYTEFKEKHGHATIERIDNDGNYSKTNCRWATRKEQTRNTSKVHRITINGETKTLVAWCEQNGVNAGTARSRILRGWEPKTAVV